MIRQCLHSAYNPLFQQLRAIKKKQYVLMTRSLENDKPVSICCQHDCPLYACASHVKPCCRFSTWLVLLQAVSGFGLPWSTTESSMISLCTTKFVVVDDAKKTSDLTIPYDICRIESPKCFVSMANDTNQLCDGDPIQQLQVETIQKAQFVDMKGNINHISHSSQHFTVSLHCWELLVHICTSIKLY